ncbi:MAG TPA: hypothetical protein RMF84_04700 [Polyangiaceae bacterium LLY-WYZ-14_1]|nr:hypothetical protein [Polyangiaceae bacterium LLY-WYZ-14_1]
MRGPDDDGREERDQDGASESAPSRGRAPAGIVGWLQLALFVFHLVAILALSLPGSGRMRDPAFWQARHTRSEVTRWSDALGQLGVEVSGPELAAGLQRVATHYAAVRRKVVAPFETYAELAQLRQGWNMFSAPQTHPAEVWIEVDRDDGRGFEPVYVERSQEHRWRAHQLDHHRVRKLFGRFARSTRRRHWLAFTRWAAGKLADDFPEADRARFRLRRWRSPEPAAARQGDWPAGRFTDEVVLDLGPPVRPRRGEAPPS